MKRVFPILALFLLSAATLHAAPFNPGQKVGCALNGSLEPGRHSVAWKAEGLSAGMYFATIRAGEEVKTIRMPMAELTENKVFLALRRRMHYYKLRQSVEINTVQAAGNYSLFSFL
ncbi:MAG: hypothetical protein ACYC9O_12540 [Candidatus Latescibacterota bacterium]